MPIEENIVRLQEDGWCLVDGVIPDDAVTVVREGLGAVDLPEDTFGGGQPGPGKKVRSVINYNQSFAPHLVDDRVLGPCEALLGPHVRILETLYSSDICTDRGRWHADWPFAQDDSIPGRIPAPYPDVAMAITTLWMLVPFTVRNGGTLVIPGTHRETNNPTGDYYGVGAFESHPDELQVEGNAGSVLMFDARLWHARPINHSGVLRPMLRVLYVPWWMNLDVFKEGSLDRLHLVEEQGLEWPIVDLVPAAVYAKLPEDVKAVFGHWVAK
jgi:hypothetical protein